MIQIVFNENQLLDLKTFCEDRLAELIRQCDGIRNILNQLEMITQENSMPKGIFNLLENNKNGRENVVEKIAAPREYQHNEWAKFILKTLAQKKTLCPSLYFLNLAIKEFNLDEKNKAKTKLIISTYLSRMCRIDKTLKAYKSVNVSEKLYGLAEWFDEEEEPLSMYLSN